MPAGTRQVGWLVALGIAATLFFAIATLPASLLAGRLGRAGVGALTWYGSVWSGEARGVSWRGTQLGDVRWTFAPLALLGGRFGADLDLVRADGRVRAHVATAVGGSLHLENAVADLPIEALGSLPLGLPGGWRGRLHAEVAEAEFTTAWPVVVRGSLDVNGLVAPPPRNAPIGSYHVVFPDPQPGAPVAPSITARVTDKEGPFSVDARFTLAPDRSFVLEGTLAPRGETPPAMLRSLELLGPADAAGRRPFSVAGTL